MTDINVVTASGSTQTVTLFVPGVAGTPSTDVMTVQGSTAGTPVPVSLSTSVTNTVLIGNSTTQPLYVQGANGVNLNTSAVTVSGALPAGEAHLGEVGGRTRTITASVTRPSNTTQYTAGDAVTSSTSAPAVMTFSSAARVVAGSGTILGAMLIDSANQTTKLDAELWLFDTTYTADNDNAVFTPTDGETETLVGVIPFFGADSFIGDATSGAGGNCVYNSRMINPIPFACPTTSSLYGALVARNAYTPVSGEKFSVRLLINQD